MAIQRTPYHNLLKTDATFRRDQKSVLKKAKFRSEYNFHTEAHHLNINGKCLCERILEGFTEPRSFNRTDNPSKISCRICIMAWDAINELGIKMKWPVAMWSNSFKEDKTGWILVPLPHHATVQYHLERIIAHMGGLDNIKASPSFSKYTLIQTAQVVAAAEKAALTVAPVPLPAGYDLSS